MAVLKILFYLVVMILVLALAYYTTKVVGNGVGRRQENSNMCVLDRMAVGRDSFLLVVKIQDQIFLMGVSPAGIEKLGELEDYEQSPAAAPSDFAAILADHVKPYMEKKGIGGKRSDSRSSVEKKSGGWFTGKGRRSDTRLYGDAEDDIKEDIERR